jgi:hypothetical protein
MPTESLILRRVHPVPVTFADLRRAHTILADGFSRLCSHAQFILGKPCNGIDWHAAIKEATGALDEVYAVIDGHEVRIATITADRAIYTGIGPCVSESKIADLLIKADEAGYWQRPHEVVHHLEESQMLHKTMRRMAINSFIVAGVKA